MKFSLWEKPAAKPPVTFSLKVLSLSGIKPERDKKHMQEKQRLDSYLFEKGLTQSREKARALIMSGAVFVDNQKALKAGLPLHENAFVEVRAAQSYVSRGGFKLEKAIDEFDIGLKDKICMDIGASTGGFTDCMLQNGAAKVFAVDVGYGQLAWKLRSDPRIVSMERTNIRYVTREDIGQGIDFCSADVSFISLRLVLPVIYELLEDNGSCVCLIKPQFEAGRENVGKNGVVREKNIHENVINTVFDFTKALKFNIINLSFSPIKGPEGNIEFLMYITKGETDIPEPNVKEIVENAHAALWQTKKNPEIL